MPFLRQQKWRSLKKCIVKRKMKIDKSVFSLLYLLNQNKVNEKIVYNLPWLPIFLISFGIHAQKTKPLINSKLDGRVKNAAVAHHPNSIEVKKQTNKKFSVIEF